MDLSRLLIVVCFFFSTACYSNITECFDCGKSGWQKMSKTCTPPIKSKEIFLSCLKKFKWTSTKNKKNEDLLKDVNEGFINIGDDSWKLQSKEKSNSIKVFQYKQWACDKDGQLYLFSQLG